MADRLLDWLRLHEQRPVVLGFSRMQEPLPADGRPELIGLLAEGDETSVRYCSTSASITQVPTPCRRCAADTSKNAISNPEQPRSGVVIDVHLGVEFESGDLIAVSEYLHKPRVVVEVGGPVPPLRIEMDVRLEWRPDVLVIGGAAPSAYEPQCRAVHGAQPEAVRPTGVMRSNSAANRPSAELPTWDVSVHGMGRL